MVSSNAVHSRKSLAYSTCWWVATSACVSVNYSLVMLAPNGGVVMTCKISQAKPSPSCAGVDLSPPWMFNKSDREGDKVSVVLDGLRFEDCAHPLQFDNLDHVTVNNCWFRCAIAVVTSMVLVGLYSAIQECCSNYTTPILSKRQATC